MYSPRIRFAVWLTWRARSRSKPVSMLSAAASSSEGRLRLIKRVQSGSPIAQVTAEAGIARATLSKWVSRYRTGGPDALEDRSGASWHRSTQTPPEAVDLIEEWRRTRKWFIHITHELQSRDVTISVRTVTRWLDRVGMNRHRDMPPPERPTEWWCGSMRASQDTRSTWM